MWLTIAALIGTVIGAWLWVRMFTTPPDDTAADRRLRKELSRHETEEP